MREIRLSGSIGGAGKRTRSPSDVARPASIRTRDTAGLSGDGGVAEFHKTNRLVYGSRAGEASINQTVRFMEFDRGAFSDRP
jgi:hypothetical protein